MRVVSFRIPKLALEDGDQTSGCRKGLKTVPLAQTLFSLKAAKTNKFRPPFNLKLALKKRQNYFKKKPVSMSAFLFAPFST